MAYESNAPFVNLQWFAEDGELVDLDKGKGSNTPVDDGQGSQVPEPRESYFYSSPDGQNYKTREELDSFIKSGTMMRGDYSRKTAELSKQRNTYESERQSFDRQRKEFEEEMRRTREEFRAFDEKIRKNPQIYQYLQNQLKGQSSFDNSAIDRFIEQKYGDKFKRFEEWENSRVAEAQQKEAIEALKLMYEDFDFEPVNKLYQNLMNGNMQSLMEELYYANKGRSINPLDVERQVTRELENKKKAGLVPSGGSKAGGKPPVHRSLTEAAEYAKRNYSG